MELATQDIKPGDSISEIVKRTYQTADVFSKYGIDYCCGGKWPLKMICENRGLDTDKIIEELHLAQYEMHLSHLINYLEWEVDFLIDFIIHIHHRYFVTAMPGITALVESFINKHKEKYPGLADLTKHINNLSETILKGIRRKQEVLFPYIKQISHAHAGKELYASVFARTLKKPLEEMMQTETKQVNELLTQFRIITNSYTPPDNSCVTHKVVFARLREVDINLQHNRHLEYDILFPRALAMERELVAKE